MTVAEMILVTGGAASGKSALAEEICCGKPGRKAYLATMKPHGQEAWARIARHRKLRAGKGFDTLEWYGGAPPRLDRYDLALLEDTGNLVANRLFDQGEGGGEADILEGIEAAARQVGSLVVVGNLVFSDALPFDGEMEAYLACLGSVHRWLADRADLVVESVCGLPYYIKGEGRP